MNKQIFMEKNIITINHDKTAHDAAKIMNEKDISFLVVMRDGNPIGVVTERDFVGRIAAEDKKASEIPLLEITSMKFRWVEPMTEIEDAVQKMLNHNIRRLVVLENEKLAGIVTQTDLTSYLRSKLLIEGTMKDISSKA